MSSLLKFYFSGIGIISILSLSCKNDKKPDQVTTHTTSEDSIPDAAQDIPTPENKKTINYVVWNIKGNDSLRKTLTKSYTGDSAEILRQINRTDIKYWVNKDTFLVPDPFSLDMMDYSLFPSHLDILKNTEKFVIFSYEFQIYGVYSNGVLEKWGATNMGKQSTPTPTGLFFANWKGRRVVSTVNSSWILQYNFNIHNTGGIGWHQYSMPGYPVSHSCLRLFMEDAIWLYNYADQWTLRSGQKIANGTPVMVFGDYPWGGSRPWYQLLNGQESVTYSVEKMNEVIQPYIDKINESESNRLSLKRNSVQDSIQ